MFNGVFVSATSGVSKAGKAWFKVTIIGDTMNGETVVLDKFVTEDVFKAVAVIPKMTKILVKMTLNSHANWDIFAVKVAEGGAA